MENSKQSKEIVPLLTAEAVLQYICPDCPYPGFIAKSQHILKLHRQYSHYVLYKKDLDPRVPSKKGEKAVDLRKMTISQKVLYRTPKKVFFKTKFLVHFATHFGDNSAAMQAKCVSKCRAESAFHFTTPFPPFQPIDELARAPPVCQSIARAQPDRTCCNWLRPIIPKSKMEPDDHYHRDRTGREKCQNSTMPDLTLELNIPNPERYVRQMAQPVSN